MSLRAPLRGAAAGVAAVLLLAGCSGSDPTALPLPSGPGIVVDSADLRAAKEAAGIEDCTPGTADSELPAVSLPCLGGGPDVDLSGLQGPLVINFWYAACRPCRTEMPVLGDFYRRYGDQVPVLGVDLMDTLPGKAIELAGEREATYPQLADPDGELLTQSAFSRARSTPYLAFVDAGGVIVTQKIGGVKNIDELVTLADNAFGLDLAAGADAGVDAG